MQGKEQHDNGGKLSFCVMVQMLRWRNEALTNLCQFSNQHRDESSASDILQLCESLQVFVEASVTEHGAS